MNRKYFALIAGLSLALACGGSDGTAGADGQSATVTVEPAGTNCPDGGVKVQVGNGTPTYVCNGADGQAAAVTAEPAGTNCPDGGLKVQVGAGMPAFVCNGAPGADGADGTNGKDGANGQDGQGAVVTPEPVGEHCANGGLKVQVGNGTPAYVCNGAAGVAGADGTNGADGKDGQDGQDGAPGQDGQSAVVTPEPIGKNCANGGVKVQAGDGTPSYLCNPAPAPCAGNQPPVIDGITVDPVEVQVGETATVTVHATDADDDPLQFAVSGAGGALQGGTDGVFTFTSAEAGTFRFTVTVTDGCQVTLAGFAVTVAFDPLHGGIRDGVFQSTLHWQGTLGATVDTTAEGNGNAGVGSVPCSVNGAQLSQVLEVTGPARLRASFDCRAKCTAANPATCDMMGPVELAALRAGGLIAVQGYGLADRWTTASGCLGEAAFGDAVEYSVGPNHGGMSDWTLLFDNVRVEVVNDHTCPAVGTALNGDMAGSFGWAACQAGDVTLTYLADADGAYLHAVQAPGSCMYPCLTGLVSVPFATTMPHAALKFDYRTEGTQFGYDFNLNSELGGIEYHAYNTATWASATVCIGAGAQGRAGKLNISRGAGNCNTSDYIDLRKVRLESDAVACP